MIPDFLRATIEECAETLPGWQPAQRCLNHAELVLQTNPHTVVEIGVYGGRSLIPVALALKYLGNGGKIYGIDPWHRETAIAGVKPEQEPDWRTKDFNALHNQFMSDVYAYKVQDYVVPIRSTSDNARELFPHRSIDILHIDGSHEENQAEYDAAQWQTKVKLGGYIWFDDSDFISTQKALRVLDDHCAHMSDFSKYRLYEV